MIRPLALCAGLLLAPTGAFAVAQEILEEHLDYCLEAIALADPTGPTVPDGVQANDKGAIAVVERVAHFAMKRDSRDDWVCELGDRSETIMANVAEDFLDGVRTVDKSRSTYGGHPYLAATICVGPNAVAMIVNGPLNAELDLGTVVFSGGKVSAGCAQ